MTSKNSIKNFRFSPATFEAEKAKEEDDLDFKVKQRRRSSVGMVTKSVRSASLVSHDSFSGSEEEEEDDDANPREIPQRTSSGFKDFCIRNIEQASKGRQLIERAEKEMPGIAELKGIYGSTKPLSGGRIVCCSHISCHTAVVVETLVYLGAEVRWSSCNIYSAQNDVAAAAASKGMPVFGWKAMAEEDFWWAIDQCLVAADWKPNLLLDDGGDATDRMVNKHPELAGTIRGVVECSAIGVHRLHAMLKGGVLKAPALRIDDAVVKSKFDTIYSCRESIIEILKTSTNVIYAGLKVLVCGYGDVGKGIVAALKGMGALLYVSEVDPICALQACMEGCSVIQASEVIQIVDCVIACTGNKDVLKECDWKLMKDGCIVCNMGHPCSELDTKSLKCANITWQRMSTHVDHVTWPDGRHVVLLCEGRTAALCTTKTSSLVASVTATTQILALLELFSSPQNHYENNVYILSKKMDEMVARIHLNRFNAHLTNLTSEQCKYLGLFKEGPFKAISYRY